MRVFDSMDDVRKHFEAQIQRTTENLAWYEAQPYAHGKGSTQTNNSRMIGIAGAQRERAAYLDALAAIGEVRPGFTEALERNAATAKGEVAPSDQFGGNGGDWLLAARIDGQSATRRQRRFPTEDAVGKAQQRWAKEGYNTWWLWGPANAGGERPLISEWTGDGQ